MIVESFCAPELWFTLEIDRVGAFIAKKSHYRGFENKYGNSVWRVFSPIVQSLDFNQYVEIAGGKN